MYFHFFWQNYCRKTIEDTTMEKVPNERKLIYAIYNFIVASWCPLYIAILYLPPIPVICLKNAPINIAMLIFTNILEMHCLKVANMYERTYQYLGY